MFDSNTSGGGIFDACIRSSSVVDLVKISDCEFIGDNRMLFKGSSEPDGQYGVVEISNCLFTGSTYSIDAWVTQLQHILLPARSWIMAGD